MKIYDLVIIGGGIIGLAVANDLIKRNSKLKILVVEKDSNVASQQSGHNSGVIHSGIYYKPGSFKAQFCVEGRASMTKFCQDNEIPVWTCGKLIVATKESDIPKIDNLFQRGVANNVEGLKVLNPDESRQIEPYVKSLKSLHAPGTGIVNYETVTEVYGDQFKEKGGEILLDTKVIGSTKDNDKIVIQTTNGDLHTKKVINCAGLHSDRIAK